MIGVSYIGGHEIKSTTKVRKIIDICKFIFVFCVFLLLTFVVFYFWLLWYFTFGFCGSQRMQRAVDVLWGPQWALTECIQWGERRQWSHLRFSMEKPIDFWLRKEGVAGSVTPTIDTVSFLRSICRTRLEVVAATGKVECRTQLFSQGEQT